MSAEECNDNADNITLKMECFEDELSPLQINAYETAYEKFNKESRMLSTIVDKVDILYENSIVTVICIHNNTSLQPQNDEVISTGSTKGHFNSVIDSDNLLISKESTQEQFNSVVINSENFKLFNSVITKNNSVDRRKLQFRNTTNKLDASTKLPKNLTYGPLIPTANIDSSRNNMSFDPRSSVVKVISDINQITTLNGKKVHPTLLVETKPNEILISVRKAMKDEEQLYLFNKIKLILSYSMERFINWISRQGLLQSEKYCGTHRKTERSRLQLRLKHSNTLKFLSCGRYVWVSNCCPRKYISIFKGTLFEGAPYAPTALIMLLYHWSCQTDLLSILESAKVSKGYLRTFYMNLRSVCVAAVHEDCKGLLGGRNRMVEVGLVSLEIESDKEQVHKKTCILGILDADTKCIRMHVVKKANLHNHKIFQFLTKVVNKHSIILTDLYVKKFFFTANGFKNVYQEPIIDQCNKKVYSNEKIMTYLKNCLPRMFGNSLSFLDRPLIQLCLDELCWREKWGVTSLRAFNSIINHIRVQTYLCSNVVMSSRLSKISSYPFMDWQYSNWESNFQTIKEKKIKLKNINKLKDDDFLNRNKIQDAFCSGLNQIHNSSVKRITSDTSATFNVDAAKTNLNGLQKLYFANYKPVRAELVHLESYYYGIIYGNKKLLELERKNSVNIECSFCCVILKTNICLMKHIVMHAFSNYISNARGNFYCKYCLKQCSNLIYPNQLRKSSSDSLLVCVKHYKKAVKPNTTCLICEQDFKFRTKLILHMHFSHDELELPYECGICRFRSSQHRITVDHFYEVHNNGKNVQCPLCLKVVTFIDGDGLVITRNMYFFLNHIKRHNCENLVRRCDKCVLTFVNERVLNYHQRNYHNSCKDLPNIQRHIQSSTMMPTPVTRNPVISNNNNVKVVDLLKKCTYKKFSIVKNIETVHTNAECCECEGYITEDNHLVGEFSCSLCRFKTCCDKSMFEHIFKFHSRNFTLDLTENRKIILNDNMYCICGFKSVSGNKLANHLISCGKMTVYSKVIE